MFAVGIAGHLSCEVSDQLLCHVAWSGGNEAGLTFISADNKTTAIRKIVF
jgi:hypothetical protein